MQDPKHTDSPMKLENLLQVPLQVIKLEDLLREKSSLISPTQSPNEQFVKESNEGRLCHSADSFLRSSFKNKWDEGRLLQKSLSTSCLFDCCSRPSRWRDTKHFSNRTKFKTTALKLPDGSAAIVPVMDFNEDTLTDVEMEKNSDDEEKKQEISTKTPEESLDGAMQAEQNSTEKQHEEIIKISKRIFGEDKDKNDGEGILNRRLSGEKTTRKSFPTILGTVTENPTRYEDLILSHGSRVISANSTSDRIASSISLDRMEHRFSITKEFNGDKDKSEDSDTLKLTFYNDGRKESVKEFRTGLENSLSNYNDSDEADVRYFANPQGLQLSRVLRDSESKTQKSNPSGGTSENTQSNNRFQMGRATGSSYLNNCQNISRNSSLSSSSYQNVQESRVISPSTKTSRWNGCSAEKTWEQNADGLQISRCQREANNQVINLNGNKGESRSTPTFSQNSSVRASENEKGEAETLIERHLQSYLTSMRYVKPPSSGETTTSPGAQADHSNEGNNIKRNSVGSSPETLNRPIPILPNNITRGHVGLSPALMTSPPSAQRNSSENAMMMGTAKITRVVSNAHQISPTQHQFAHCSTAPVECVPERAIARIQTRPYLRRNTTYEQPRHHIPLQQVVNTTPGGEKQSLHSHPKRFKPTNLSTISPLARQHHEHHHQSFVPSRYPNGNNEIVPGGSTGNNNIMYHHSPPLVSSQQQHHHFPTSSHSGRNSSYANIQQQQSHFSHQQTTPFVSPSASSTSSNISNHIRSPHRSPVSLTHVQQQNQQNLKIFSQNNANHSPHQQQQLNDSIMIAAAAAAANSSQEPFDNISYYERLRRYWEYYQKQELDWTKLAEYYQKYHFYPWDILSARDVTLLRHWKNQHQEGGNNLHDSSMKEQQHQLALKAMHAANATPGNIGAVQKALSQTSYERNSPQHGRIQQTVMNVSPPQASPPVGISSSSLHKKYNYNSQQLHQLQQNEAQSHQMNQQSHLEHQQTRYFPSQHHIESPNGKRQNSQKLQQFPTNYDIQTSSHYKSAYNQLAAAAAAVASAAAVGEIQPRIGTSPNVVSASNNNLNEDKEYRQRQILTQPTVPLNNDIQYQANNFHRHTLELALKNNFRENAGSTSFNTNKISSYGVAGEKHALYKKQAREISPPQTSPASHLDHRNSVVGWSSGQQSRGTMLGMNKEPLQATSLQNMNQQASVIRRIQPHQQELSFTSSGNLMIRKQPYPRSYTGISASEIIDQTISATHSYRVHPRREVEYTERGGSFTSSKHHHLYPPQQYPPTTNASRSINVNGKVSSGSGVEHEDIIGRKIGGSNGIKSNLEEENPSHQRFTSMTVRSPVPLIVGEEEIVTANVSPSAVLLCQATNAPSSLDEEATLDGNEVVDEDDRTDANGNNSLWQYDHVVLLDKRIKSYMCKRCFETLKTEQQIRNHLFCKMLANHVQCHVCLQLVSSDGYPSHLQVHGVRPPDDDPIEKPSNLEIVSN